MIDSRHIQDDFGNSIPMLDAYGNLSVQVIMLYAEDKLTEADRRAVDDFAAKDEMSRDALDGYALLPQTTKTRTVLANLNTEIQHATGSAPLQIQMQSKVPFNYRTLAAAIALLIVVGAGSFWAASFFSNQELAEDINLVNSDDSTVSEPEQSPHISESKSGMEDANEPEKSRAASEITEKLDVARDDQSKLVGNSETSSVKTSERLTAVTGAATIDRDEDIVSAPIQEQKEIRSEENTAKASLADANLGQQQGKATVQNENQRNTDRKGKDLLAKEAESRASVGRMREESAKTQIQSDNYDGAYELATTPTTVQPVSNASELSAKFPGGDVAMYKFIEKKKTYPDALRAQNVTGTISVWFDIETDGRVTNARIKSGENGILNEDALRVVRSMPKWKPAQNSDGEAIKSSRTVVIKYEQ